MLCAVVFERTSLESIDLGMMDLSDDRDTISVCFLVLSAATHSLHGARRCRSSWQRHLDDQVVKKRVVRLSEEALCRSTKTGICDAEIVDRRQRAQALCGKTVKAMMVGVSLSILVYEGVGADDWSLDDVRLEVLSSIEKDTILYTPCGASSMARTERSPSSVRSARRIVRLTAGASVTPEGATCGRTYSSRSRAAAASRRPRSNAHIQLRFRPGRHSLATMPPQPR